MTIEPPEAKQIPSPRTFHGDTVIDEYAWLADSGDPDTIDYLRAENAYTETATAGLASLRDQIFEEIKARTQESDLSVPVRKGGWWHYSRTVEGKQYAVFCRCAVRPGEAVPPMADDGKPLDGEEELLDGNELAAGREFFSLGAFATSPDQRWLAYSTDFSGNERFTIRIKDLATGATLPDEIPDTYAGCAWSQDGSTLFYTTVDDAWRPYRVWRHRIGTPAEQDTMVFEETDEKFHVYVGLSRSQRFLRILSSSVLTSEVWLLDAATPEGEFAVVTPRRQGLDYDVEPAGDRLLILHNDHGAENFEIATAPLDDPSAWTPLIPHRADTRLLGVDAFADYSVVYFRRDGLTGLRILRKDGEHEVAFGEPVYRVGPGPNPEFQSSRFRLSYTSLVTPGSVYDCDMATGELTLLKRQPVLPSPAGVPYRPGDYEQHREWAVAPDGTRVPISLVCRKGTPRDGTARCLLYGYGTLRDLPRPGLLHPRAIPARPRLRLRDRARQGRRRDGPVLVRRRQAAAQEEHVHRFRRVRPAPGRGGLDLAGPAGGPGRFGGRPADGRGGQHGPGGVRRDRGARAVRGRADHDPGPVAAADRDRMGGVGRPAARPRGLRVHEVVHAVRERRRTVLPGDLRRSPA